MQCIICLFDFQLAMGAAPRLLWVPGSSAGGTSPGSAGMPPWAGTAPLCCSPQIGFSHPTSPDLNNWR